MKVQKAQNWIIIQKLLLELNYFRNKVESQTGFGELDTCNICMYLNILNQYKKHNTERF